MYTRVTSVSEKKQKVPKAAAIFRWELRYRSLRGRSDNGFCRGYYMPRRAKPSLAWATRGDITGHRGAAGTSPASRSSSDVATAQFSGLLSRDFTPRASLRAI